ncbi:MAG: DUF4143 domain-containing protein, partial [Gammaproteobacteria bacterium]
LAKENKKFLYSVIRKSARAKEFENALQWLLEAGLIHKVHHLSAPKIPLEAHAEFEYFKVYVSDVGLLGAMVNLSPKLLIQEYGLLQEFRGSLLENYVSQTLVAAGFGLYYWTSEGKAELDYILQVDTRVLPLEIKSGESSKKKSLQVYLQKYQPEFGIRSSPMNLKKDGHILNCPLYLLGSLREIAS